MQSDSLSTFFAEYLKTHSFPADRQDATVPHPSIMRGGGAWRGWLLSCFLCFHDIPPPKTLRMAEDSLGEEAGEEAGEEGGEEGGVEGGEEGEEMINLLLWSMALRERGVHIPSAALMQVRATIYIIS